MCLHSSDTVKDGAAACERSESLTGAEECSTLPVSLRPIGRSARPGEGHSAELVEMRDGVTHRRVLARPCGAQASGGGLSAFRPPCRNTGANSGCSAPAYPHKESFT